MSKAAELAALISSQTALSNRNLIINGAMQVAQRGTSYSSISGSTYTLDRFAVRNATAVSQSTDVPSGQGFKNSLFYDSDGSRSSINIRQPMEDVTRLLNDKAVTLSFWLKSSAATTISVDLCDANSTNVSVTTSWAKYEVTFPATSNLNSGNTYEAGAGWIDFNFGTDYPDVYLTGVQLEVGEQATPFEHRSFGDELARCQRYFCKSYQYDIAPGASASLDNLAGCTGVSGGTTATNRPFWFAGSFPVKMRTAPTITLYHYDGTSGKITGSSFASYDGTVANVGEKGFNVYRSSGSTTADSDHYCIFAAEAEL